MKIFYLTLALMLVACSSKTPKSIERNVLIKYYKRTLLHNPELLKLSRIVRNDSIFVYYQDSLDTLAFSFQLSCRNDSSMFIYGINCPLVAKKQFEINGKVYWINKYYYDEEDLIDEESFFFYTEDYGLLALFNEAWGSLIFTMEYDQISKHLADSVLGDQTGFYKHILGPIQLIPDSVTNEELIDLKDTLILKR